MNRNAKFIIFALLLIAICLWLALCSKDIVSIISGKDGKCDYCSAETVIKHKTKEYCAPCFQKYDGNIWN